MPLFMDVHKGSEFTLEELKRCHLADLEIQDKYGVRYVQYWVNDEAGMVFCLMEGPSKEACAQVHREAHGDIACNIIQVEKGDYELLMGITQVNEFDMVEDPRGGLDPGYRVFVSVTFVGLAGDLRESEFIAGKTLRSHGGREVIHPGQEILGVFNSCKQAVGCAKAIQADVKRFIEKKNLQDRVEFRIGIGAGEPVTESDGLFIETRSLVRRLNAMAANNQVIIGSLVKDLYSGISLSINPHDSLFKVLTPSDERLLTQVMEVAEKRLSDRQFTVAKLGREVGLSRPQLYRRIMDLADVSPNDLIRELRLKKAEILMRKRDQNISEIALEVGFNSPSYFSKCFHDRFGSLPSQYLQMA